MTTATAAQVAVGSEAVYLHRLLTDAEATTAAQQVLKPSADFRAKCWHTGPDLSTIGTPLYRTRDRLEYYTEQARVTNALMYDTYRWLYDRVADFFEDRYSHPVDFVDGLAIPGFHLMAYGGAGRFEGGGWHLDQLAQQVPYFADRASAIDGIVNFTLPLAVPGGGTGMDIRADEGEPAEVHVPYRPGVVLFTDRELLHRIGASVSRGPADYRLTLQGHGVCYRRRLLLFW
ncbi:hypothetical protein AB0E63_24140 [Kribbella sp. NPDC026596]|uniref:hypothetical protein n=1 Tax=Kribbella sp. NPDC026596 TaxID=3155122 RepID=UPI0033E8363E